MKIEIVINDSLTIPVSFEMLEAVLGYFEVNDSNTAQLEALADHPAKDVRVRLAGKENLTEVAFRKLFGTRDFFVIQELLGNSSNASHFSREMLAGLIGQSEFGRTVAGSLGEFPHADDGIAETLAKHPDPYVRNALAGNFDTAKKFLKLLANDADPAVAKSAMQSLE